MRNIKLVLEYDGSKYYGWQWQPRGRTIQGELQRSLQKLLQESTKVIAAGRTDSGVHALGQVVNFKTENTLDVPSIRLGINSYLPGDVRVLSAVQVHDTFHARFDARSRVYRYVISKRPRAVGRQYAWYCKYLLEVAEMKRASSHLLGSHRFTAFSRVIEEEPHYLCEVYSLCWKETNDEIEMEICANRFLHHMVRLIVGTMVEVGRGKLTPGRVQEILASGSRKDAGSAVPPQGLFLVSVNY
ncbi:MAG: tRNA pseudouridine(38-40) synthase TruA [bacterium]